MSQNPVPRNTISSNREAILAAALEADPHHHSGLVLEITHLSIKGIDASLPNADPKKANNPVILDSLCEARQLIKEHFRDTQSRFFYCSGYRGQIFIFGWWPNIQDHMRFLASEERKLCLGDQENVFEFQWTVHIPWYLEDDKSLWSAPILSLSLAAEQGGAGGEGTREVLARRGVFEMVTMANGNHDGEGEAMCIQQVDDDGNYIVGKLVTLTAWEEIENALVWESRIEHCEKDLRREDGETSTVIHMIDLEDVDEDTETSG